MAFNGSGVFQRLYSWVNDAAGGIKIRADRMDNEMNGFATGLSNCITKDGQTTVTANLPMATYRHTNVGNGQARTDYAALGQVQDGKSNWVVAGGTVDAITASYSPAITALVDGQECNFRASGANTSTTPTFSPNGLTPRTIVKNGGAALAAGDIPAAGAEIKLRYNLANTEWELFGVTPVTPTGGLSAVSIALADSFRISDASDSDAEKKSLVTSLMNLIYPVGSIVEFNVSTNPNTLFGIGTWALLGEGKVTVCYDSGDSDFNTLGGTGGAKTHTLTIGEIPAHSHTVSSFNNGGWSNLGYEVASDTAFNNGTITTSSAGSGGAHNNLQPYVVVYRWERTA